MAAGIFLSKSNRAAAVANSKRDCVEYGMMELGAVLGIRA